MLKMEEFNMKKKIFIFIVIILIIIISIIVFYLHFIKKEKEEVVISDINNTSLQSKYLNSSLQKVLEYLSNNDVKENTPYNKINVNTDSYKNCNGEINVSADFYTLSGECDNDSGYMINYNLIKSGSLKQVYNFIKIDNGYLYIGVNKNNSIIVGLLNDDNSKVWQTDIGSESENSYILSIKVVSDGYLIFLGNIEKNMGVIKLDTSGKLVNETNLNIKGLLCEPSLSNDEVAITNGKKIIILDNNGNVIKQLEKKISKTLTYYNKNIYYVDDKNKLHILDINGVQKKSFKLKGLDDNLIKLEIVNGNIFALSTDKVTIYDKEGSILSKCDYSLLLIKDNKKTSSNYIVDEDRNDNDIYINVSIGEYTLIDHYDENLNLIERKVYSKLIINIDSSVYNDVISINKTTTNIQYSEKYGMFVKINYLDE
jgi:hypothetical protein